MEETTTQLTNHHVAHHFDDAEQQFVSAELGMWIFLATEVLFFGGVFLAYAVYRFKNQAEFIVASHQLDWILGTVNTMVLLTSSLTMVLAVHAAQTNRRGKLVLNLALTALLGLTFLGVKAYEYHHKYVERLVPGMNFDFEYATAMHSQQAHAASQEGNTEPDTNEAVDDDFNLKHVELFFSLYFAMTGLHGLHMIIGIGFLGVLMIRALRGHFDGAYFTPIEMFGMYWHFVDIVWVFLFPLLYLIR